MHLSATVFGPPARPAARRSYRPRPVRLGAQLGRHRQAARAAPAGDRGRHAQPRRQPAEPRPRLRGDGGRPRRDDRRAWRPRRRPRPLDGRQGGDGAGAERARPGAAADRRRHRAGRLCAQPARLRPRHAGGRPRRRSAGGRRATPRWRRACRSRRSGPSCCRASRSARTARAWKLNLAALADQMPAIMDFPDLARDVPRPDAVPDRGGVGLRAARALAAHPRAVSRRRASRRSPAPATGCTPTRPPPSSRRSPPSSTDPGFTCRPRRPAGESAAPAARVRHRPARGALHHLRGLHRLPLRWLRNAGLGRKRAGCTVPPGAPSPGQRAESAPRRGRFSATRGRAAALFAGGCRVGAASTGLSSVGSRSAEASGRRREALVAPGKTA